MSASAGQFAPRQAIDPITVEVIGAALSSIVEETGEALVRPRIPPTSRSGATARRRFSTSKGEPCVRRSTFRFT